MSVALVKPQQIVGQINIKQKQMMMKKKIEPVYIESSPCSRWQKRRETVC